MRWKILPRKSDDLFEQLLINRGIKTEKARQQFLDPYLGDFEKSLNIPGIDKAKKRIMEATANQGLIIAYGDYDVDGICGAAILYLGLSAIGAKILPYIPHREKEGYGLSKLGLEFARSSGASLVITTDCGIVNFEEAIFAKEIGLDLIITDHHQLLDDKVPECLSVVHCSDICGAAVAWSLIGKLLPEAKSKELLDLVAIATISDMMPLLGINRALVTEGLKRLNKTERVGLLSLINNAGVKLGEITSYEIGHIIAPRLNAMGRLDHAIDSLRLLCTKDPVKARKLTDLITETNNQRKLLTETAITEARLKINGSSKKIHVLSSEKWAQGIIGLVAGRICDETGCSTIAISVGQEYSKGSARANGGVNIVETLRKCSDILVAVGGHKGAAGFTIETNKIEQFSRRLEELFDGEVIEDRVIEIEEVLESNKLSLNLAKLLQKFEPFGVANQRPVLATNNMKLTDLRTVGQGKHLKGKADNIDFIGFGIGDMLDQLIHPERSRRVNLAYTLDVDSFNGYEKLQLKVRDIQL